MDPVLQQRTAASVFGLCGTQCAPGISVIRCAETRGSLHFDTLRLNGANKSYDLEGVSSFGTVVLAADLPNDAAETLTIESGVAVEITAEQTDELIIDQVDADAAGSSDDTQSITLNPSASATQTDLTVDDVETVNLTSTTSADDATSVTNEVTNLDGSTLGTLNISGDVDLTFDGTIDATPSSVDASEFTGDLTIDLGSNGSAAQVTGGTGDDSITGTGNRDLLTGGDGADTFVFADGDSVESSMATVTDFTVSGSVAEADTLDLVEGAVSADTSDTDVSSADEASNASDIDAAIESGILSLSGDDADVIDTLAEWVDVIETDGVLLSTGTNEIGTAAFEFDGDTYVYESDSDGVDQTNLVKLQGLTGIEAVDTTAAADTILIG
jgi:hypothetical protein